jgi:hypothetical protein
MFIFINFGSKLDIIFEMRNKKFVFLKKKRFFYSFANLFL